MSNWLAHDLPREKNQGNLSKQIGCMMGIFQMFDRRRLRRKQLSHEFSQQETPSRASISSTSCSSLSPHPATLSLDFRDVVKDSITTKDSLPAIKVSSHKPPKKIHVDSPRPSIPPPAPPRSSLDSHSRSSSTHLHDLPRWSLDSKQSSLVNSNSLPKSNLQSRSFSLMNELAAAEQRRPAGVVAKLMGLEELPNSPPLRLRQQPNSNGMKKSTKKSTDCQHRPQSPIVIMKPLRSIEKSMQISPCSSSSSSSSVPITGGPARIPMIRTHRVVNGEDRSQPGKAAKLSPRPLLLAKENASRVNMVNTSGSTRSPRLQQMNFEPNKAKDQKSTSRTRPTVKDQSSLTRAQTPPPMKAMPPQQRNYTERLPEISVNSMRSEVNARIASSPGRKCIELASISIQREKDAQECLKQEQPSPVSVLDFSLYREDSQSTSLSRARSLVLDDEVILHKPNMKTVDQLLQKLWRLSLSNHDDTDDAEDDDDGNDSREDRKQAALNPSEMDNPRHQYVYEVLHASGYMDTHSDRQLSVSTIHRHSSVVDPGLFLVLEKSNRSKSKIEKLQRRLLFDAVNEALTRKVELTQQTNGRATRRAQNGEHFLKELCMEIDGYEIKQTEEDDALKPMICRHVAQQSDDWADFGNEVSSMVLDIERTIFRDLISDLVNGEITTALTLPARYSRHRRRLQFS